MADLYFGYGSNLNAADFARWCADRGHDGTGLRLVGPAFLPDHEPVFHYRSPSRGAGALSVRPRPGAVVAGALFEADAAAWRALDRKEGVRAGEKGRYARRSAVALTADGAAHPATTYEVTPEWREPGHVPPSAEYLDLVVAGLEALGHDSGPVRAAAEDREGPADLGRVFVYGTLLTGELREPAMRRHRPGRVEPARVRGRLVHLGSYPGLLLGDGEVRGELFHYEDASALLADLDEIEDFGGYGVDGSLYRRSLVRVGTEGGQQLAWTYVYLGSRPGRPIPSGAWRERSE